MQLDDRFLPDYEMADYLGAANVCLFPFESMSISRSLLFPSGYDLPVTAPALPAVRETVGGEYPLLYEPNSAVALTDALRRASQMNLSGLRPQALAQASAGTWNNVAEATAKVYRTLRGN